VTLYAYCILPGGLQPPEALTGIAGAAVEAVPAGDVACWASRLGDYPAGGADVAREHNAVVVAAMDREVTPVPLRFGQTFTDRDGLASAVGARSSEWIELLGRFAGRAEYGIRVARAQADTARDVHPAGAESGTAYMAALARRQADETGRRAEGERIGRLIRERAGALIADARLEAAAGTQGIVSLAHMVAWNDADAYHALLQNIRSEMTDLRFLYTGPWPPYSFVE
jgi:hypothetical protein